MSLSEPGRRTLWIAAAFAATAGAQFVLAGLAARALPAQPLGWFLWLPGLAPLLVLCTLGLDKEARSAMATPAAARRWLHARRRLLLSGAAGCAVLAVLLACWPLLSESASLPWGLGWAAGAALWLWLFAFSAVAREGLLGRGRALWIAQAQVAAMVLALGLAAAVLAAGWGAGPALSAWLAPQALIAGLWAWREVLAGDARDVPPAAAAPQPARMAAYWSLSVWPLVIASAEALAVAALAPADLGAFAMMGKFSTAAGLLSAGFAAAHWSHWRQAAQARPAACRDTWRSASAAWLGIGIAGAAALWAAQPVLALWLGPLAGAGLALLAPAAFAVVARAWLEQCLAHAWACLPDRAASRWHTAAGAALCLAAAAGALAAGAAGAMWLFGACAVLVCLAWTMQAHRKEAQA